MQNAQSLPINHATETHRHTHRCQTEAGASKEIYSDRTAPHRSQIYISPGRIIKVLSGPFKAPGHKAAWLQRRQLLSISGEMELRPPRPLDAPPAMLFGPAPTAMAAARDGHNSNPPDPLKPSQFPSVSRPGSSAQRKAPVAIDRTLQIEACLPLRSTKSEIYLQVVAIECPNNKWQKKIMFL